MSNLRRVLERQQKEREEIRRRCAEEDRDADEEEEQMLAAAVCMLNQSRQHRRRAPNVDRRRESRGKNLLEDYFIPNSLYPVSKFRERYRMQPQLFQKIMYDICNYDTYFIQKHDAVGVLGLIPKQKLTAALWMLAYGASAEQVDEIVRMGKSTILESLVRFCNVVENLYTREYLRKPTPRDLQRLLKKGEYGNQKGQKSIILEAIASFDTWVSHAFFGVARSQNDLNVFGQSPVFDEERSFASFQEGYRKDMERCFEGYRKDVERCFGILQARWAIIRGAAWMLDEEVLRSIMMTYIILRNMIVEDEYDYDALEVFEPDPMNTALTRIYERPMGPNGLPMEPDPLLRDGQFNNPRIDRYQEMQSSYVHDRRQVDLIEHLWERKGNHNG
ncbi:uncharacterized protein LOC110755388 [Prunus avium]|uniref:Uncharacterized protein LOC110755388 n=1 Tax=Prunus avium TaxID=42229 RepID=A0A6P5SD20_PRUAV|nr:uncharacterized protein LOC110755388 [Prunus avium]